jgi:hypothetical protein
MSGGTRPVSGSKKVIKYMSKVLLLIKIKKNVVGAGVFRDGATSRYGSGPTKMMRHWFCYTDFNHVFSYLLFAFSWPKIATKVYGKGLFCRCNIQSNIENHIRKIRVISKLSIHRG